jgi:superfamily II DNA/RNA helicase
MEIITDAAALKEVFRGEDQVGSLQEYVKRLGELHHRYLESQLGTDSNKAGQVNVEELMRFVIDAQYLATEYSNPLVILHQEGRPLEEEPSPKVVQDALALAGTIFEFLGDLVDSFQEQSVPPEELPEIHQRIGKSGLLYLKSALCYGLGIYEARTKVILSRLLDKSGKEYPQNALAPNNAKQWQEYLFLAALSCDFQKISHVTQALRKQSEEIRHQFRQAFNNNRLFEQQGRWSTRDLTTLQTSLSLIESCLLSSEAFLKGNEATFDQALTQIGTALITIRRTGDYDFEWVIRTFRKVISHIWANSPWIRLGPFIPKRSFIRSLIKNGITPLWSSQLAALEMKSKTGSLPGGYLNDHAKRVVLHMPTSAGKTLLAQIAIAQQFFSSQGKYFIYVGFSRALCDQVANDLAKRLIRFGVHVTSVVSDNDIINNSYESLLFIESTVIVVTPEKLSTLFRQKSSFLHNTTLFIFDELHTIGKQDRGWVYEELITLCMQHPNTQGAKMLFLSAVMPNHLTVQEWVDPEQSLDTLSQDWQPTRTLKGFIEFSSRKPSRLENEITLQADLVYIRSKEDLNSPLRIKNFIESRQVRDKKISDYWKPDSNLSENAIHHAAAAAQKFTKLGPVLIYCPTRDDAVDCANQLAKQNFSSTNMNNANHYHEMIEFIERRLSPGHPLGHLLRKRVAFHHGSLPRDVRNEIEFAFQKGWIQILVATTTLAEGVNFPIKTLLFMDYCQRRWDRQEKEWRSIYPLPKSDFKNISGRAGRALYETEGQVIFLQSILGYPRKSFDIEFRKYLALSPDSTELNINSSLEDSNIFQKLSEIVEAVDNNKLSDEQLLFDACSALEKSDNQINNLVEKLQVFTLLLQDQNLVGEEEETYINIFQGTFLGKRRPSGDMQTLGAFSHRSARAIRTHLPEEHRSLFAQTGLKISTCRRLMERVHRFWENQGSLVNTFLEQELNEDILYQVGNIIYNLQDPDIDPKPIKVTSRTKVDINHVAFFVDWITYEDTLWAFRQFQNLRFSTDKAENVSLRAQAETNYIRDALEYKTSWVLSAFWIFSKAIVKKLYGTELMNTPLGEELILLPAYAKFGVNTPAAALFSTLGCSPAQMARELSRIYLEQHPLASDRHNYQQILQWLLKSEPFDLAHHGLQGIYVRRVVRLLSSLRPIDDDDEIQETDESWEANFKIAGWWHHNDESILQALHKGQRLIFQREPDEPHDPNAIRVLTENGHFIGYVPRRRNQEIGEYIDSGTFKAIISGIDYQASNYEKIALHCWVE